MRSGDCREPSRTIPDPGCPIVTSARRSACLAAIGLLLASPALAQSGRAPPRNLPPPVSEPTPPDRIANPVAVFAGLDKITGRIVSFNAKIGETVQFGALQVTPRVCYTRPATEQPETVAFVEVNEITLQKETKRIFTGWMFADSPGLNAVEHPIYDVWVTDCRGGARPEPPPTPRLGE
jgi:hypothetical protein